MFRLDNKVALITGARQGMGKAHALALSSQGAKVVVTDINEADCQNVVGEIIKNGGEAICFKMDVSNVREVDSVISEIIKKFGRLDILINNAGIYFSKTAMDLSEEEWDRMIDINLKGQFFVAQRSAKEMMKNKWGRVINIASIASGQTGVGVYGAAHYTASKGGIIGMSETLALEWAQYGINVNVIAPGAIDTPMARSSDIPKEALGELLKKIPLKRMGTSEEVAAMAVFLSSDESSYVTGATFYVDGGWLAA